MKRIRLILMILNVVFFSCLSSSGENVETSAHQASSKLIFSVVNELASSGILMDSIKHQDVFVAIFKISEGYRLRGDYDKAVEFDFFALNLAERLNQPDKIGRAFNNIAISYYSLKKLKIIFFALPESSQN